MRWTGVAPEPSRLVLWVGARSPATESLSRAALHAASSEARPARPVVRARHDACSADSHSHAGIAPRWLRGCAGRIGETPLGFRSPPRTQARCRVEGKQLRSVR